MEDDKLKSFFSGYDPEQSSDMDFLGRVQRAMHYVDMVKDEVKAERRNNRKSMAMAALAGFIVGFIFSMALPYITESMAKWCQTLPDASHLRVLADYTDIIAWALTAALSLAASLTTYDLTATNRAASGSCQGE